MSKPPHKPIPASVYGIEYEVRCICTHPVKGELHDIYNGDDGTVAIYNALWGINTPEKLTPYLPSSCDKCHNTPWVHIPVDIVFPFLTSNDNDICDKRVWTESQEIIYKEFVKGRIRNRKEE